MYPKETKFQRVAQLDCERNTDREPSRVRDFNLKLTSRYSTGFNGNLQLDYLTILLCEADVAEKQGNLNPGIGVIRTQFRDFAITLGWQKSI